jgi:hypothetical protein
VVPFVFVGDAFSEFFSKRLSQAFQVVLMPVEAKTLLISVQDLAVAENPTHWLNTGVLHKHNCGHKLLL